MKRLIDHYLQQWKNSSRRKALLIRGARQVGKTYSVRRLGESFEELVEINLEMNPEYAEVFRLNLDPQRILRELRLMTGKRLVPGSSLLFIDEIQQHPAAVTALRYFYEEIPELHVAANHGRKHKALASKSIRSNQQLRSSDRIVCGSRAACVQ